MLNINLYELRKAKGITQSCLAEELGVSFQTISKWENGKAMPDISYVIAMAKFFHVTTDQVLGLQPIQSDYFSRMTESAAYWNDKLDYMNSSRADLWNEDYMEFLIQKVWKIREPINVLDYGCGNGYLAGLMLPLLPKGSTYTGIDVSDVMIEDACRMYAEYPAKFVCRDGYDYQPEEKYDMVICQAFLRELSNPEKVLKNMIAALKPQGLIVCIEVDRELDNAGTYIDGIDYDLLLNTEVQRKYWKTEYEKRDRDYAIGIRLPFILDELGIQDIEVRVQDKVRLANPNHAEEYEKQRKLYIAEKDWKEGNTESDRRAIEVFINRGLTREEAEHYVWIQNQMKEKIMTERKAFLKSTGFLITFGRKG